MVSIKSKANNKYLCATNNGDSALLAISDTVSLNSDSCEIFKIIIINENENSVSFNSITNYKYLTVNAKDSLLSASTNEIETDAERFELITNQDGTYSLKSKLNKKYVCAENNGDSALVADRSFAYEWENFNIQRIIIDYDYEVDPQNEKFEPLITEDEFNKAVENSGYPKPSFIQYNNIVNKAEPSGNVSSKLQLAMFLATILWESDGLRAVREYKCWPTLNHDCDYSTGIGPREVNYYGRGYIQLVNLV